MDGEGITCVCVCVGVCEGGCTTAHAARQHVCMCVSHNPCLFHRKMDVVSCLTEKNGLMKFSRLPR